MTGLHIVPPSRQITQRMVMRAVMRTSPVSRAELARLTGLSKQTISEVVRALEREEWLTVTGRTSGGVGRSAVTYEVPARRAVVFGADVGGTRIQAALADLNMAVVVEATEPTDPRGGEFVIDQIARLSETLLARSGLPPERLMAGTVGFPGAYDRRLGRLAMAPNIEGLEGLPIETLLGDRLGYDLRIENDVNMAARGEQWLGEGRGLDSFAFIALGTGIGMGIINEGRIIGGARGAAGEISTLPIGASAYDSRTFAAGALETALGSAAIKARYEGHGGRKGLGVRAIIDRIGQQDLAAAMTLDEVARILAEAIRAVCAVVDPERIILGGSIGARAELLERVRLALPRCMPEPVTCTISRLGSRAGLYGAIAGGLERLKSSLFVLEGVGHLDAPSFGAAP